jgi:hypothetical protein
LTTLFQIPYLQSMAKLVVNPDRTLCEVELSDEESIGPVDYEQTGTMIIRDDESGDSFLAVGEDYDELDLKPGLYSLTLVSEGVTEGEIEEEEEEEVEEQEEEEEEAEG